MALNREQRRALMRQELEGEDTIVANTDPDPTPVAAPAAAQAVTLTFEQLKELIALASQGSQAGIGDQIATAIQSNRQPKPETYLTGGYHEQSHYHPAGVDAPRPVLAKETFFAVWDATSGRAQTAYPLDAAQMRDDEIEAMNAITPGTHIVTRNDGTKVQCRVIPVANAMGETFRTLIAFDPLVFSKESKNSLPPLVTLAQQLTGTAVAA